MDEICRHHGEFNLRISRNESDIKDLKPIHDKVMSRINGVLIGIAVACILLVINILVGR